MKRGYALLRSIPIGALCLLAVGPGKVRAQQSDVRLDALANELALMRRTLAEQEKRLSALEQAIKELRDEARPTTPGAELRRSRPSTSAQSRVPWQVPGNWDRVQFGMSDSQVMAILGPPTSVERVGSLRTLFYRGEVSGSGLVSGNVKLLEDRVYLVNKPVF